MAQNQLEDSYGNPYEEERPEFNPDPGYYIANPVLWPNGQATAPAGWNPPPPKPENPQPPNPQPPAPAAPGSGGSNPYTASEPIDFQWPTFTPPTFDPGPGFQAPPPFSYGEFSYDPFSAPTLEQAQQEPGYEFAREQGVKALENSAAARGILRTGGTLKDILSWGNRFGEQNYGNVYNRNANTYSMNRGNAFQNFTTNRNNAAEDYQTNYGVSRDVFDRNYGQRKDKFGFDYQGAYDQFQPQQRQAELTFADQYQRWRDILNSTTSIATAGAGA